MIPKVILFCFLTVHSISLSQTPISLHPENPHYFLFRGKPTILISSAEHYGMVLNSELDYEIYLDVLQSFGFNQTRVFSGVYCEGMRFHDNSGNQANWEENQNTLAPRPNQFITPWQRSDLPGYINGGNRFDLNRWDEAYFTRLKDFCRKAGEHGVIVEIVLFTANYTPQTWLNSPLQSNNNINGVGDIPYNEFHLLKHEALIEHQLKMVRKIVTEVNDFDNVYFEICNEPYWMKGIPEVEPTIEKQQFLPEIEDWQNLIIQCIVETEQQLPKKHLIAQNYANTYLKIQDLNEEISVLNFHYAFPPACVPDNYHWNRPIGFDETFDGCNAPNRRKEAWAFILAGGAVYSNLDWSFATDDLTGLGRNPTGRRQSGKEVREQLKVLHSTMRSFDYIHARPIDNAFFNDVSEGVRVYGLAVQGKDYISYWLKDGEIELKNTSCRLPSGTYQLKYIDPLDGEVLAQQTLNHSTGEFFIEVPFFFDDLVVRMTRVD